MSTRDARPPLVDVVPNEPGPRLSPFAPGGVGMLFVHVSNRNQCSYLFDRFPEDEQGLACLDRVFPMGYATLYVLQKVCAVVPQAGGAVAEDEVTSIALRSQERYAVLVDPHVSPIGGSAMRHRDLPYDDALAEARALCRRTGRAAVVALVTDEIGWH